MYVRKSREMRGLHAGLIQIVHRARSRSASSDRDEIDSSAIPPAPFGHAAQQPTLEGLHRRLRARVDAELVEDVLDVGLDGLRAEVQLAGDLFVGLSLGKL